MSYGKVILKLTQYLGILFRLMEIALKKHSKILVILTLTQYFAILNEKVNLNLFYFLFFSFFFQQKARERKMIIHVALLGLFIKNEVD